MHVHGTCVAAGPTAALLRGPPGSGKSDLALRFLHLQPLNAKSPHTLIADDQVHLSLDGVRLVASCPPTIQGLIEVRGVGIISIDGSTALENQRADLRIIVDMSANEDVPRLPPDVTQTILGVRLPLFHLDPFEASAPIKLALLINRFMPKD